MGVAVEDAYAVRLALERRRHERQQLPPVAAKVAFPEEESAEQSDFKVTGHLSPPRLAGCFTARYHVEHFGQT